MYLLILLLPLFSFLYTFLLGRCLGQRMTLLFCITFSLLGFLLSLYFFYEVVLGGTVVSLPLYSWARLGLWEITLGLYFDFLTCVMLVVITSISFLVHFYSLGYMSHDPYILRFMSYLSLFTFFMLLLVTADNFFQLFLGWEGVGLCSYLLINFWYSRILANKAALKAMIMNRISDVFFILGIVILFLTCKSTDFLLVFHLMEGWAREEMTFMGLVFSKVDVVAFFFFIGAVGKSAQLGLHTWLPDAMEGPTPVSALLHAATMVTAGVFLILRASPIFEYSSVVLSLMALIGALTALFSALVGVFQYDVKKLIAFSTCSQLGYMFLTCAFSAYPVAIFHLFNHAFFKALLFLGAGSIIHALADEQDMRRMGRMLNFLPFTYTVILIASLAIMGFPFLTGFYSKDILLEVAYSRFLMEASFVYSLALATAFFTAVYSVKLLLFVFFYENNGFRLSLRAAEDSYFLFFPLFILAFFSLFMGYLFSDIFIGFGFSFLGDSLAFFMPEMEFMSIELLSPLIKNLPFFLTLLGSALGLIVFYGGTKLTLAFSFLERLTWVNFITRLKGFFFSFGYFNVIYNSFFLALYSFSYYYYSRLLDKGLLEWWGPYGLYKATRYSSLALSQLQPYKVFLMMGWMFSFFLVMWLSLVFYAKYYMLFLHHPAVWTISLLFFLYLVI